jgi:hypothetical protein
MSTKAMALVLVGMWGCSPVPLTPIPGVTAKAPQQTADQQIHHHQVEVANLCLAANELLDKVEPEALAAFKQDPNSDIAKVYTEWVDWYFNNACEGGDTERLMLNGGTPLEWSIEHGRICMGVNRLILASEPYKWACPEQRENLVWVHNYRCSNNG